MPHPLIRKLNSLSPALSAAETDAVLAIVPEPQPAAAGADILDALQRPHSCAVLVEGLAARYKLTPDGRRQVVSVHVPGDILDLYAWVMGRSDYSVLAVSDCRVSRIGFADLERLVGLHPRLGIALWRDMAAEGAVFREWVVGLGQRSAYERIAHFLCEFACRLRAVGIGSQDAIPFPLTQALLGDTLGMSAVHVNRVLQQLRREGLIALSRGQLAIRDLEALEAAGAFDPAYLAHRPPGHPGPVAPRDAGAALTG